MAPFSRASPRSSSTFSCSVPAFFHSYFPDIYQLGFHQPQACLLFFIVVVFFSFLFTLTFLQPGVQCLSSLENRWDHSR